MKKISSSTIISLMFFIGWEILGRYINLSFILPWPTLIIKRFWELKQTLICYHLVETLKIAGISLGLSLGIGIILAVLMDRSKKIENAIYPILVTSQTIPITALAPIFILWFGYSIWSKILVAVIITFFPVTINLSQGLKSVKEEYLEFFKSMNASEWDIFIKLKLPSVMPYFFSSLKMAVPFVIIGATIGEWLGATAGLGYFSKRMMTQLDGAGVFAPVVLISVIVILIVKIISIVEDKLLIWVKKQ
ncbi:ABC transporter permease [Fusobacterium sp.]|uniref:ABC transporter permease n=1 Tax=Fusobacterium sp. TaxID=68766 RepID=UPI0026163F10|nr:ABC transporter permease [Fusobacterium sp.]